MPKVCVNLTRIGERFKRPICSYLNKEMEKENPNPKKFHKLFFLKP